MATTEEEAKASLFSFFNNIPNKHNPVRQQPAAPTLKYLEGIHRSDETLITEQEKVYSKDIHFPININPETLVVKLDEEQKKTSTALQQDIPPEQKLIELEACFKNINEDIENVVNVMGSSSSIIDQVANKWGNLHILAKTAIGITGGIIVIGVGTFGIMAHMILLPSIMGATGVVALSGTLLLENHYQMQQSFLTEIKQGFISLASILQMTIFALEKIRIEFSQELKKLKTENIKFEENNKNFAHEIENLTGTVSILQDTKKELENQISQVKEQVGELESTSEEYKEQIDQLKSLVETHKEINAKLESDYEKLTSAHRELAENQKRSQEMVKTLNSTISALTSTQVDDEEKRQRFLTQLSKIICKQDEQLKALLKGFKDTESELSMTTQELDTMKVRYEELNTRYSELLKKHQDIVERQEKAVEKQENQLERLHNISEHKLSTSLAL